MHSKERNIKPWLTPSQQVAHLKSKGVKFNLISDHDAQAYLSLNNNYFRLRSYRTGFSKVDEGHRKGEYANLDFKMLVDLSIVDMLLRYEMLPITLDIEHFAKMKLLARIESEAEDGYGIVADYIASYDHVSPDGTIRNLTRNEIGRGATSPYIASLIDSYPECDYPAWAFMEVIAFGTFIHFYKFCANRFKDKKMLDEFYLLQTVKSLRNACAHNNCILNNTVSGVPMFSVRDAVSRALSTVQGVNAGMRKSKMRNDRIQQIATTLYVGSAP